jgi:NAD(P)H-flavin reductase
MEYMEAKKRKQPNVPLEKSKNLPIIRGIFLYMIKASFTLISKKALTHDVYELTYSCPEMDKEPPKPGQYVMFQLAPGLNRAYSISSFTVDTFTLVIKRVSE